MSKVLLISSDQKEFQVELAVATKSQMIKKLIQEQGAQKPILLPKVPAYCLKMIIIYCEHYLNLEPKPIPTPLPQPTLHSYVDPWDQQFISINPHQLTSLLNSAQSLQINSLIQLCCAKVASLIKQRSPQEVIEMFGVTRQFSAQQLEQIRQQNRWREM